MYDNYPLKPKTTMELSSFLNATRPCRFSPGESLSDQVLLLTNDLLIRPFSPGYHKRSLTIPIPLPCHHSSSSQLISATLVDVIDFEFHFLYRRQDIDV
jgi:hypothetical protein